MKRTVMKKMLVLCFIMLGTAGMLFANGGQEAVKKSGGNGATVYQVGDMSVECKIDGEQLGITVSAPTEGWIAVGFEPSSMMKDANIIMGAVVDGELVIADHFGTSAFAHQPDTDLGGSSDVTAGEGSEEDGNTTLSFTIPLDSGDPYDRALQKGNNVKVILAYAKRDGFGVKHSYRSSAEITLK